MAFSSQHHSGSDPGAERRAGRTAFPRRWIFFASVLMLLLVGAAGLLIVRAARREHRSLRLLCNQVERAAAPGEPVLVDGWWLNRALHGLGSPALQSQLVRLRGMPDRLPANRQEWIYVGPADGPLARTLRADGFVLQEPSWVEAGHHGDVRVFFVR